VDSHAKGDVVAQIAIKPELVRIGKSLGIPIGRGKIHGDRVAGWNPHS
jgi:hypothetical protein